MQDLTISRQRGAQTWPCCQFSVQTFPKMTQARLKNSVCSQLGDRVASECTESARKQLRPASVLSSTWENTVAAPGHRFRSPSRRRTARQETWSWAHRAGIQREE